MYSVYLGELLLPVTPASIDIAIKNQNKTLVMINDGEVNLLKTAGLTDISFTALLPQVKYPFARYEDGFMDARWYLQYFESLKRNAQPFQFIVSRCLPGGELLFDTNMRVSLEDYKISENSKEGFDINVDIRLKQYRLYGTKRHIGDSWLEIRPPDSEPSLPEGNKSGTVVLKSKSSHLNVRKEASSSASILGKLKHGDTVTILGSSGSWYRIAYTKGADGKAYVSKIYIRENPPKNGKKPSGNSYNNGSLNEAQVKVLQKYLGVTADGKYGVKSDAAARKRWGDSINTANKAWSRYQEEQSLAFSGGKPFDSGINIISIPR